MLKRIGSLRSIICKKICFFFSTVVSYGSVRVRKRWGMISVKGTTACKMNYSSCIRKIFLDCHSWAKSVIIFIAIMHPLNKYGFTYKRRDMLDDVNRMLHKLAKVHQMHPPVTHTHTRTCALSHILKTTAGFITFLWKKNATSGTFLKGAEFWVILCLCIKTMMYPQIHTETHTDTNT